VGNPNTKTGKTKSQNRATSGKKKFLYLRIKGGGGKEEGKEERMVRSKSVQGRDPKAVCFWKGKEKEGLNAKGGGGRVRKEKKITRSEIQVWTYVKKKKGKTWYRPEEGGLANG